MFVILHNVFSLHIIDYDIDLLMEDEMKNNFYELRHVKAPHLFSYFMPSVTQFLHYHELKKEYTQLNNRINLIENNNGGVK